MTSVREGRWVGGLAKARPHACSLLAALMTAAWRPLPISWVTVMVASRRPAVCSSARYSALGAVEAFGSVGGALVIGEVVGDDVADPDAAAAA